VILKTLDLSLISEFLVGTGFYVYYLDQYFSVMAAKFGAAAPSVLL